MQLFLLPMKLYVNFLHSFMRGLNPPPTVILAEENPLLIAPPKLISGEPATQGGM